MKKLILIAALAISAKGLLYAQDENESYLSKQMSQSKAEQTFNAGRSLLNIRDFITLKEGRLILELTGLDDYESFRNLDSILGEFRKDITFYKDSLMSNPTGNVRIDYCYSPGFSFKKMRFKKYNPDGSMFLNQGGEISKLKFEEDTVRIIIQKSRPGIGGGKNGPCMIPYSIQATFLLNNYYDVDKVIADHVLNGIVDALEKASQRKRYQGNKIFSNPFTIVYNPYYSGAGGMIVVDRLMKNEYDFPYRQHKNRFVSVNATFGEGLVRNTVASTVDLGIQYNRYWGLNPYDHNIFRLSVSPYLFFDKDAQGNFIINDNWFVNAEVGDVDIKNQDGWFGKAGTFGAGYLVAQKGDYFKNTTFKIFTSLQFVKGFTIVPEIIFTDNCKQIFPGFTLKVF